MNRRALQIDARRLVKGLGGQAALHRKLNEGFQSPRISLEAIEKWCERNRIPGGWLAVLAALAAERNIQFQLDDYIIGPLKRPKEPRSTQGSLEITDGSKPGLARIKLNHELPLKTALQIAALLKDHLE